MALIIVISIEDFQIRWNVLLLSFSERECRKWPLGLSDFYHNYLICDYRNISYSALWKDNHLQHLIKTTFLYSNMTFFVGFWLSKSVVIRGCSNFSKIS